VLGVLIPAAAAFAHHSFAADYDIRKPASFTGQVTRIEWVNPHVRFFVDVKDQAGTVVNWQFEMGAVNGLLRRGWTRSMIKAGDSITVDGYLARDGSHLANARVITLSDGRKMSGGTVPEAPGK
jgi:hypothetical protein